MWLQDSHRGALAGNSYSAELQETQRLAKPPPRASYRDQHDHRLAKFWHPVFSLQAMGAMNRQMNMPALQKIMRDFEMQNERMEMTSEVMGDAIDDAFEVSHGAVQQQQRGNLCSRRGWWCQGRRPWHLALVSGMLMPMQRDWPISSHAVQHACLTNNNQKECATTGWSNVERRSVKRQCHARVGAARPDTDGNSTDELQGEDEEGETDELVNSVLDEIGIDLNSTMASAPGRVTAEPASQVPLTALLLK